MYNPEVDSNCMFFFVSLEVFVARSPEKVETKTTTRRFLLGSLKETSYFAHPSIFPSTLPFSSSNNETMRNVRQVWLAAALAHGDDEAKPMTLSPVQVWRDHFILGREIYHIPPI